MKPQNITHLFIRSIVIAGVISAAGALVLAFILNH